MSQPAVPDSAEGYKSMMDDGMTAATTFSGCDEGQRCTFSRDAAHVTGVDTSATGKDTAAIVANTAATATDTAATASQQAPRTWSPPKR